MLTIKEILNLDPQPKDWDRRSPRKVEVVCCTKNTRKQASLAYEDAVFDFLFENRLALGVDRIYRLKNQRMDGELHLADGDVVAFEVKYRMNWAKACQAGFQFRRYIEFNAKSDAPLAVTAGVVFFEEFSGGWQKRWKSRPEELGWVAWYHSHRSVSELPFHLVRLRNRQMTTCVDIEDTTHRIVKDNA